jgi:hypothetical protein
MQLKFFEKFSMVGTSNLKNKIMIFTNLIYQICVPIFGKRYNLKTHKAQNKNINKKGRRPVKY